MHRDRYISGVFSILLINNRSVFFISEESLVYALFVSGIYLGYLNPSLTLLQHQSGTGQFGAV